MPVAPHEFTCWPPRRYLLERLVAGIPEILAGFHPETGCFGTEPWICNDQNVVFPLAVAWSTEDDDNPYYHDEQILHTIAKGGEVLTREQDEDGAWLFLKKDYSTWGQVMQPWTYSRWIRAFSLVGDALPAASRAVWEEGLLRGYTTLRATSDDPRYHGNMWGHNQMGLYIAGICFDNEDWKQAAARALHKVADAQEMGGYWSEHFGPVISYNRVYVELLGIYYAYSRDEEVLTVLERAADFHSDVLLPDGTNIPSVDERNPYNELISLGNAGFSWTPKGRSYLLRQLQRHLAAGQPEPDADYAAAMLLHSGEGTEAPLETAPDQATVCLQTTSAIIKRCKPWQWTFTGFASEPPISRWVQDRQNLVDIYHDDLGLVAGSGHTKLQPLWSTFTVGDTSLIQHREGDTDPDFNPEIALQWTPDVVVLNDYEKATKMRMKYGDTGLQLGHGRFAVYAEAKDDDTLELVFTAPAGEQAEAHLPLLKRGDSIHTANGTEVQLGDAPVRLDDFGGWLTYAGLRIELPAGAYLVWPVLPHDPYVKDGKADPDKARPVLCMPFDEVEQYRLILAKA